MGCKAQMERLHSGPLSCSLRMSRGLTVSPFSSLLTVLKPHGLSVVPEHVTNLSFSPNPNATSLEKFSLTLYLILSPSIPIPDHSLIHYPVSYSSQHFCLPEGILGICPLSGNSVGQKDLALFTAIALGFSTVPGVWWAFYKYFWKERIREGVQIYLSVCTFDRGI